MAWPKPERGRVVCSMSGNLFRRVRRVLDTASAKPPNKPISTGVCEITTPFRRAFALQPLGRDRYPAHDLVLRRPIFLGVFFSRGVFFSQTPVGGLQGCCRPRPRRSQPRRCADAIVYVTISITTTNNNTYYYHYCYRDRYRYRYRYRYQ